MVVGGAFSKGGRGLASIVRHRRSRPPDTPRLNAAALLLLLLLMQTFRIRSFARGPDNTGSSRC